MRVRLRAKNSATKPPRVDRAGPGRINGLSLITKGEALGHGFWIDETTLSQVAEQAEGSKGRWTHGNLCADGLGTHLGRWENVKQLGDSVVGDFAFSPTAKNVKPEGLSVDAPTYLMDLAERDPDAAGVSTVLELDAFALEELSEADKKAGKEPKRFARTKSTPRADFVGDPAANPDGLFAGTPSELSERASSALDEAAERFGAERVRGFLAAYLNGKAQTASLSTPRPQEGTVDIEQLKKQHAEELAARDASIAALKGQIEASRAVEKARRQVEVDAYVASLKERAGKAQRPLAEAEVAKVVKLFEGGHDEAARIVGDALAAKAEALGAGPFERATEGGTLSPSAPHSLKAEIAHQAASLRDIGWTVELSADGTQITKRTPPNKAGR